MLTGRLSAQLPCSRHSFLLKKEPPGCVDLKTDIWKEDTLEHANN